MAGTSEKSVDLTGIMISTPTEPGDWLIIAPMVICLGFGASLLMFRKETGQHAFVAMFALGLLVLSDIALLMRVLDKGVISMTMGRWLPPFGISFTVDALGATLALTSAVVAFIVAGYAVGSSSTSQRRYGFFPFLLLLMAGVSGSFLTGDIFNLYVWFEVLLIASFGLLILGSEKPQLDGATKYAFPNLVATTLFLVATGYLYGTFGTLNMADIARKAADLRDTGPLMTLAVLYLFAFGMKAAAFPVNFWLPASYHTPRIVVSALFAGLLTKVGIYALLRTQLTLFSAERAVLGELIAWVAAATMIFGVLGALAQSDIRRLFGFVVVSGIGTMMAGLALGSPLGLSGTIVYAVHSMIVMTALYLLAGMIHERAGSFSLHSLSGLYASHPLLAAFALVLVLAAAGLPPFSGLWPKAFLVKAAIDVGAWWLAFAILLTALLTTIALGRVFALAFWRGPTGETGSAQPELSTHPALAYAALFALTTPIVVFGVYPEPLIQVAGSAAWSLLNGSEYIGAVFPLGSGQ